MKAFVTYLKKESPATQRPSGSTGWIEMPNGQRWNPGHRYKFNAHDSVRMKGGVVLRFLSTKVRRLVGCIGGRYGD
ncbi:phage filamentation protein Fil family protein [Citrobacter braakii]